jgi:hypothetical protein
MTEQNDYGKKTSTPTYRHRDIGRKSCRFASCISSFSHRKKS